MNFSNLILYIDEFFNNKFDHDTLSDSKNNPFVQINYVKTRGKFISQTYSFYVTKPGHFPIHDTHTRQNLSAVSFLTSTYLLQDPKKVDPYQEKWGYCNGFATTDNEIFTCAVATNKDDSKWVCDFILGQLKIYVNNQSVY